MSTPVPDLPADSTHLILEMPGQSALSGFRLERLLGALREADDRVHSVDARFAYFIHLDGPLGETDRQKLDALLLSGEPVHEFSTREGTPVPGGPPAGHVELDVLTLRAAIR